MLDDIVDGDNTGMVQTTRRTGVFDTTGACQPLLGLRDSGGKNNFP